MGIRGVYHNTGWRETMEIKPLAFIVKPVSEDINSELSTIIQREDEGGGEFITVTQPGRTASKITIEKSEWRQIKAAIDKMFEIISGEGD
ncbi:hypothetical protein [Thiothrix sp.]|uniref:hypothetical protein n=1 Tax=Thiothrix sp. TaxID=1032 RepID=UPI00257F3BB1|nr:hypothetical protein [Thiothrix sp.]